MTTAEINKLHFPCLLHHKLTGLVIKVVRIDIDGDGMGYVKYAGASGHMVGDYGDSWDMQTFSQMDNNELYEDQL